MLAVVTQYENIAKLVDYSIEIYLNKYNGEGLDSTGPNSGPKVKNLLQEELKISGDFDFRIYKTDANNYQVYICDSLAGVTVDEVKAAGDGKVKVNVTGYKYVRDSKGNYQIIAGTQQQVSLTTHRADNKDYVILVGKDYE